MGEGEIGDGREAITARCIECRRSEEGRGGERKECERGWGLIFLFSSCILFSLPFFHRHNNLIKDWRSKFLSWMQLWMLGYALLPLPLPLLVFLLLLFIVSFILVLHFAFSYV